MIIQYYPFAWVGFHQSGTPNMAYEGFGTYSWDGENFNSIINEKQPTYRGVLDPAKFRAEYMGHNLGWPVMFLGQGRIRNEAADKFGVENVYDHVEGLALLHDTGLVNGILTGEREERMIDRSANVRRKHWLDSPAYQFIPYWRQDIVKLPSDRMYASFYCLDRDLMAKTKEWQFHTAATPDRKVPRKTVMIVYNDSDWAGEMRLKPDWAKLGFATTDGVTVENAVHSTGFRIEKIKNDKGEDIEKGVLFPRPEETARIENGEVIFPMTPFNYRMIVFTQPQ